MLWDNPVHRVSSYTSEASRGDGGGTTLTFTLAQAAIPCLINTSSASEVELFAQQGIRVTHTVSFKATALTTALSRGMKLVADDNSASYHVKGIRTGRGSPLGTIPAFVYADCEEQL